MWILYNFLFTIGFLLMLPKFLLRMKRRGGYRRNFLQRLGSYAPDIAQTMQERDRMWIHGVSVGELGVAFGLMDAMRAIEPSLAFVISTTTSTGYALAEKRQRPDDVLIYYPTDFPFVVRRALEAIKPKAILLAEAELWPNMLREAGARNIPLFLVNGRISESSYKGYRLIRYFIESVLGYFRLILVQTEGDKQRLVAVGAKQDRVVMTGSVKYDAVTIGTGIERIARDVLAQCGIESNRPVIVCGSTWPGEERILLDIHARQLTAASGARPLLVLVPRHAERAEEVVADIEKHALSYVRRSRLPSPGMGQTPDVLLVDSTGELMTFYSVATVVFVGKSLTQLGGQNILEPAALGKPILVGPHMENFPGIIDEFVEKQALIQVADAVALEAGLTALLHDAAKRDELGDRARKLVESRRGAMAMTARYVLDALRASA